MSRWRKVRATGRIIISGMGALPARLIGARRADQAGIGDALSRAQAFHQQGKLADAEKAYRHVVSVAPAHFDALLLLGVLQIQRLNYPEAIDLITRSLQIRPDDATAWYYLGNALFRLKRFEEAVVGYDEAVRLSRDQAKFWKDRGGALRRLNRLPDALDSYDRALELSPNYLEAHIGRGTTLHGLNRIADAMASFDRALAIKPDEGSIDFNLALCRLLIGDFRGGWPGFEWRLGSLNELQGSNLRPASRWRGEESLAGKSILLWAEPGLGETILFCRFAKLVAAKGASVLLLFLDAREARTLEPLMKSLDGSIRILPAGEQAPPTDYHCPLYSVPLALNIDLDTLPAEPKYLYADCERVSAWSAKLGPRRLPRIGLAWSGNPGNTNDHNRSIPLHQFVHLAQGPFEFFCLQNVVREADLPQLEQRPDIRRFGSDLKDFGDTAALVQHMDLVVAVDTSLAHLAGALGRPVWILLAYAADWRWLLDRDDSPWYPSARLFRQPAIGDWPGALTAVSTALATASFPPTAVGTASSSAET